MSTSQLDNVAEGKIGMKPNMAGTDGGWVHSGSHCSTGTSRAHQVDVLYGESAWRQYDPTFL